MPAADPAELAGLAAMLRAGEGRTLLLPILPHGDVAGAGENPRAPHPPSSGIELLRSLPAGAMDLIVFTTPLDASGESGPWITEAGRVLGEAGILLASRAAGSASSAEGDDFASELGRAFPHVATRLAALRRRADADGGDPRAADPKALAWIAVASGAPLSDEALGMIARAARAAIPARRPSPGVTAVDGDAREARLAEVEIVLLRPETRVALVLARALVQANRALRGKPASWWRRRPGAGARRPEEIGEREGDPRASSSERKNALIEAASGDEWIPLIAARPGPDAGSPATGSSGRLDAEAAPWKDSGVSALFATAAGSATLPRALHDSPLPPGAVLAAVRRSALRRTGLFRVAAEPWEDHDLAYRLAAVGRLAPLAGTTAAAAATLAPDRDDDEERARQVGEREAIRRRLDRGEFDDVLSIVILSLNRDERTAQCLDAIAAHTRLPHEIIMIDQGSSADALERLRERARREPRIVLREAGVNLGVGGGRNAGVREARGRYVVFLDNDLEVRPGWLEPLVLEMESDHRLAACCCRLVFPDGTVQFSGGHALPGVERIRFELTDSGRPESDLGTLRSRACDWIPGGATIVRRELHRRWPYDPSMEGAFEDNDWSLVVRKAGYRLGNAPLATAVHHHASFDPAARRDRHYWEQRYDPARLRRSLERFYRKHGLAIDDEPLYRSLGIGGADALLRALRGGAAW